jgi:PIN domain nuclease of toxin-antitoxin system
MREPQRLGKTVQLELDRESNELWLSPVSVWEAMVLLRKRRISISGSHAEWVASATARFREAPFTWEIAQVSEELTLPHADPADRFLAATAKVLDLTLVTADRNLVGLGDIATLANR